MTSQEHVIQRDLVRLAANLEPAHDRHNAYPVRKPATCTVCETPMPRGAMCEGCKTAWLENRAAP